MTVASAAAVLALGMLQIGDLLPSFVRTDHRAQIVDTQAILREGPLVLYFYPRDFTPGCTQEACLFRDAFGDLEGERATIVGVSVDDDASHRSFAERYKLPFSLVSDPDRALAKQCGIVRAFGILGAKRVTFVVGQDGRIVAALHHELSMAKHLEGVRDALRGLAGK